MNLVSDTFSYNILAVIELLTGSSGSSASDYNTDGRGFTIQTGRPFKGSPSLNGYWFLTGNLTAAEKGTGHPNPSCCRPRIMGAATLT